MLIRTRLNRQVPSSELSKLLVGASATATTEASIRMPGKSRTVLEATVLTLSCPDQCQRLYDEIEYFMSKSEVEQKVVLSGQVPTLSNYWKFRMGTSAVRVALAVNEYVLFDLFNPFALIQNSPVNLELFRFACGTQIPQSVVWSTDMQTLWSTTNAIISM